MFSLKLQLLISDLLPWNIHCTRTPLHNSLVFVYSQSRKQSLCTCMWALCTSVSVISSCHWTVILNIFPSVMFLFFGKLQASIKGRAFDEKREDGQPSLKKNYAYVCLYISAALAGECCLFSFRFQAFHFDPAPNLLCLRLPSVFSFHFAITKVCVGDVNNSHVFWKCTL